MTGFLGSLTIMLVALLVPPQGPAAPQTAPLRPELSGLLDFESDHTGGVPKVWGGGPPGTFAVDDQVVHGGRWSLRIERKADGPDGFTAISGIGVFYPDKRPTQRIGIIPDIEARPTIEGIRNGRDEVVEAALRHILGPGTTASEIER